MYIETRAFSVKLPLFSPFLRTKREFCTKITVTLEDTHLIFLMASMRRKNYDSKKNLFQHLTLKNCEPVL